MGAKMNRAERRRQRKTTQKTANAPPGQAAPDIQQSIDLALAHHAAGRLAEAEGIYRRILQAEPNQPVALNLLGVIAHQTGKNDVAVDLIAKAVAIKPDYAVAHYNLGLAFQDLGELDEAAACYQEAIAIEPGFAGAHNNLGNALKDLGAVDGAVASFHKALSLKPDYAEAHSNLGSALTKLGKLDEAVACFKKALAIKPDLADAHNNLGNALKHSGRLDEAFSSLRQALAINPAFAEAHNNLGLAFKDLGELDEAGACITKALAINPDFAEAHYNLHALLLDPGDMAPAIKCLQRAVDISPQRTDYRFMLAMLLDYSGHPGEAASHFDVVENGANSDGAKLDAWRYIKSAQKELPPIIGSAIQAFELGINAAVNDGLVLEFGVRFGTTIRQIAALVDQEVHGFDSFEGLPEAWHDEPKGSYSTKGVIPSIQENVILHKGWFEETLPAFVAEYQAPVRFVNIDCDIYSSTKTVLDLLARQIIPGTVMVFDEYIGNETWRDDEFKAFQEAVLEHGWDYEYLCFGFMTKQVVVRIK